MIMLIRINKPINKGANSVMVEVVYCIVLFAIDTIEKLIGLPFVLIKFPGAKTDTINPINVPTHPVIIQGLTV